VKRRGAARIEQELDCLSIAARVPHTIADPQNTRWVSPKKTAFVDEALTLHAALLRLGVLEVGADELDDLIILAWTQLQQEIMVSQWRGFLHREYAAASHPLRLQREISTYILAAVAEPSNIQRLASDELEHAEAVKLIDKALAGAPPALQAAYGFFRDVRSSEQQWAHVSPELVARSAWRLPGGLNVNELEQIERALLASGLMQYMSYFAHAVIVVRMALSPLILTNGPWNRRYRAFMRAYKKEHLDPVMGFLKEVEPDHRIHAVMAKLKEVGQDARGPAWTTAASESG